MMDTIAGAVTQLFASVSEITARGREPAGIAGKAEAKTDLTGRRVAELTEAVPGISEVVALIAAIAEQTNLPALATQTARATEDIAARIEKVQGSTDTTVRSIVRSIGDIRAIIGQLSEHAMKIGAAVEEQDATTRDISRNVHEAADGSRKMTAAMAVRANAESASPSVERWRPSSTPPAALLPPPSDAAPRCPSCPAACAAPVADASRRRLHRAAGLPIPAGPLPATE